MAAHGCVGAIASQHGNFGVGQRHVEPGRALAGRIPDSLHKFMLYDRMRIDAPDRFDDYRKSSINWASTSG